MQTEHLKLLVSGDKHTIYGLLHHGRCEAEEFLADLSATEQNKLVPLLHRTAEHGLPSNEQKFKHIGDGIYEFKGFQARLFCFFDKGRLIILTHGCIKKRDRLDPGDIKKACDRKVIYLGKGKKK